MADRQGLGGLQRPAHSLDPRLVPLLVGRRGEHDDVAALEADDLLHGDAVAIVSDLGQAASSLSAAVFAAIAARSASGRLRAAWLALNIEAGLPIIDAANSAQFIPQATNLQALGGISFKKGCYTGQEMVARAKFRGANKRALWTLAGHASRVPEAGEDLELKMGDNWRRTGTVLAAVQLDDGRLLVQAVMNNDMEADSVFRVRDDANTLSIEPLPYSLEE